MNSNRSAAKGGVSISNGNETSCGQQQSEATEDDMYMGLDNMADTCNGVKLSHKENANNEDMYEGLDSFDCIRGVPNLPEKKPQGAQMPGDDTEDLYSCLPEPVAQVQPRDDFYEDVNADEEGKVTYCQDVLTSKSSQMTRPKPNITPGTPMSATPGGNLPVRKKSSSGIYKNLTNHPVPPQQEEQYMCAADVPAKQGKFLPAYQNVGIGGKVQNSAQPVVQEDEYLCASQKPTQILDEDTYGNEAIPSSPAVKGGSGEDVYGFIPEGK